MSKYKVGIVIPIYLTQFIEGTIERLTNNKQDTEVIYCIVNDGVEEVKEYMEFLELPDNMYLINLPKNKCFAGSNNEGWKSLISKYPYLEYLGSLNDDTICHDKWLDEIMGFIESDENLVMVGPNVTTYDENRKEVAVHATFKYGVINYGEMQILEQYITTNKYADLIGGCCFICRRNSLEEVNFLDETFKNFCEDVDLCLKFKEKGYRLGIAGGARIVHFFGSSRETRHDHNEDIVAARNYLISKWGQDLRRFNTEES